MEQLIAYVSGHVQGVSFRYYTQLKARELHLVGYAKNLPDGRVEVLAEGEVLALEDLLNWLESGSPRASVSAIQIQSRIAIHCNKFEVFSIR